MKHRDVAIVGVYATRQAWRIADQSPFELVCEAVDGALANAGLTRGDVDGVAVDWPGPGGVRDEASSWSRVLHRDIVWTSDGMLDRAGTRGVVKAAAAIAAGQDGRTEIFATYWIDRAAGDLDDGSYQRRLDQAKLALPDDIAIWNNQIFLDPPVLATEEGSGFRRIRRWARQFYPGDSTGNAPTGIDDTRSPAAGKLETDTLGD